MPTALTSKRTVIDYKLIDPFFDFQLGKVRHIAAHIPLEEHVHQDAIELSYFIKGEQIYTVGESTYTIKSGEVFMTFPGEHHSSGHYPKDKSQFYYLIVNINLLKELLFDEAESNALLTALFTLSRRVFKGGTKLTELFEALLECGQSPTLFHKTRIKSLLSELLMQIIEDEKCTLTPAESPMNEVLDYINSHLYETLSLSQLAHMAHLSEGRFKTNFRLYTGLPPREYILRQKVKQAKKLLKDPHLSITQISYTLGFSSSQYFSTVFKRFTTLSPIEYRNH